MTDGYKIKRVLTWVNGEEKQIYPADKGWKPGENTLIYYPLNGNANDLSGNGNNGTASNITWDSGGDGGCASFNGTSSYIGLPSLSTPTNFTINCWIKTTMSGDGEIIQLCSSTKSLEIEIRSGRITLELWNDRVSQNVYTGTSYINDGIWHNVCLTKTGTSYIIFIDNQLDLSASNNLSMEFSTNRIGMHTSGNTRPYGGYIDNMIIESKARTAEEISEYYNLTKSNYGL